MAKTTKNTIKIKPRSISMAGTSDEKKSDSSAPELLTRSQKVIPAGNSAAADNAPAPALDSKTQGSEAKTKQPTKPINAPVDKKSSSEQVNSMSVGSFGLNGSKPDTKAATNSESTSSLQLSADIDPATLEQLKKRYRIPSDVLTNKHKTGTILLLTLALLLAVVAAVGMYYAFRIS